MNAGRRGVPTLPVPLLRDAIARQAARLSLRRAAREIAVSPNGLRNFLNGSIPHTATRAKLEHWLAAQGRTSSPNLGHLLRLLNELAADLSPGQVAEFGRDIADLLIRAYEARRLAAPRWLQELLRHFRPRRPKGASEVA